MDTSEEKKEYMCELMEKLQNEKDLSLKHLYFIIKTIDYKKASKNSQITKNKKTYKRLDKELMDILWSHKVKVLTDDGEFLLRKLTKRKTDKVYHMYLLNKTVGIGPKTLEMLLDVQKKKNNFYQDLVDKILSSTPM